MWSKRNYYAELIGVKFDTMILGNFQFLGYYDKVQKSRWL